MKPGVKAVTLLDLRLGLISLTTKSQDEIRRKAVPILAGAAIRIYREGGCREAGESGNGSSG